VKDNASSNEKPKNKKVGVPKSNIPTPNNDWTKLHKLITIMTNEKSLIIAVDILISLSDQN